MVMLRDKIYNGPKFNWYRVHNSVEMTGRSWVLCGIIREEL